MYGKLFDILRTQRGSQSLIRERFGPSSLNFVSRKNSISTINKDNLKMSHQLRDAKCAVPSIDQLRKREDKNIRLKAIATSRKPDGSPRPDPLTLNRKQFLKATLDIDRQSDVAALVRAPVSEAGKMGDSKRGQLENSSDTSSGTICTFAPTSFLSHSACSASPFS